MRIVGAAGRCAARAAARARMRTSARCAPRRRPAQAARRAGAVRGGRAGRGWRVAQLPQRIVGRRQIGGIGEPHQHHVGGGERAAAHRALLQAFQQHLPGARQHGNGHIARKLGPRRCSSSVSDASFGAPGASFSRVTTCVNSARSPRTTAGIGAGIVLLLHARQRRRHVARHHLLEQIDDASAVGKAEHGAQIVGAHPAAPPCAIAWSSSDSASRTEPSAARAIIASASGSTATPSFAQMSARCRTSSVGLDAAQIEAQAARAHRHRHFLDLGRGEEEFDMLRRFFERLQEAVEACFDSMCTSSMM